MIVLDQNSLKNSKISLTLIIINIFCFIGFNLIFPYEFMLLFVQINILVIEQLEVWRLITAMFLHADVMHLFFNMVALLLFGVAVENSFSKLEFIIVYFLSGLIGNLFSLILLPPYSISLGASGGIFGLIGAAFVIIALSRERALLFLGLGYVAFFVLSSIGPGINLWAHLFGLIGGILFGYLFSQERRKKNYDYY